ncbi:pseudouridine synthase [Endozoicomonas elysicola]|uniref:Pseudouridine synthase n=1 Tax=Endozoicomonas elysicola TaxID=305900 RepID=A0A081K7H9_9GAMM|nr:pseudouridine synthase [Endozoicomonas elysicola]KEI70105.1 pseudouridine synthase [Endozoicomonas elysicola]
MSSKRTRLDRFLAKHLQVPRKQVRLVLLANRITVDGDVVREMDYQLHEFDQVALDGQLLRGDKPRHIMVHKPVGVVSATKDDIHPTVLDLLPEEERHGLHIVGRLDLNTSGLVLLTNDSRWSKALMAPDHHVAKEYLVTLQNPLSGDYIPVFRDGMYFGYEGITTLPATLEILSPYQAKVVLVEGKYHQIKRMFGRFRNPVVGLHRSRVGNLILDSDLPPGQWRHLTSGEIAAL